MGRSNPALQDMWGKADNSHFEAQIATRDTEIAELKQQLSLLQQTSSGAAGVEWCPIDALIPLVLPDGLTQPRKYFDPDGMEKLKNSIARVGVQEPLLARPGSQGKLEIISGERRWRTSIELGLPELPVIAKELSDEDALEIALVANLMREDLNLVEETDSIIALLGLQLGVARTELPSILIKIRNQRTRKQQDDQAIAAALQADYSGIITADVIARIDGVFRQFSLSLDSFVSNRLSAIQKMPEVLLEAVREGQIAFSKADVIRRSGLSEEEQRRWLETTISQGLSKKALMTEIKQSKSQASNDAPLSPPSLRDEFHQRYTALRKKQVWERIEQDAKLKKKFARMKALADELLEAVED